MTVAVDLNTEGTTLTTTAGRELEGLTTSTLVSRTVDVELVVEFVTLVVVLVGLADKDVPPTTTTEVSMAVEVDISLVNLPLGLVDATETSITVEVLTLLIPASCCWREWAEGEEVQRPQLWPERRFENQLPAMGTQVWFLVGEEGQVKFRGPPQKVRVWLICALRGVVIGVVEGIVEGVVEEEEEEGGSQSY